MRARSYEALLLSTLQRLLEIPSADLSTALALACDAVADAFQADKVDAFMFDPSRNSLVALGTSNQPLSMLERSLGLDVLQVANGGRVVQVFETRRTFRNGRVREDPEELKGIRDGLKIESKLGVPIEVGGELRGVLMVASLQRDFFGEDDERFVVAISRWVGHVAHRAELVEEIRLAGVEQGRRVAAEELVTVLAHDLRNLVATIDARLQRLQLRAREERRDKDRHDADMAMQVIGRLTRLISDILDVARIDRGMFLLEMHAVDLGPLVAEIAQTLTIPTHEIRVVVADSVRVCVDPPRLTQCLENLISNAILHSPRGSPVMVFVGKRTAADGQIALIDVVDEGPGVPLELMSRLFERYAVGEGSKGLGLGLYLARRIAAAHGGDLTVESSAGKGTRFRIELPASGGDCASDR